MAGYYLHFTASDAMVESEVERTGKDPAEIPDSMRLGPFPDYVELTYEYLRVGPDGDHIAVFDSDRGGWVLGVKIERQGFVNVMNGQGLDDAPAFSDVAISTEA